ncbi:MAG: nucleotide pyrophosphohydrolase [Longimicrobiales bacterium]
MDLKGAQRRVDEWIGRFEEGYWPPLANLARLVEEVGELARLLNHEFGPKTKKSEEARQELAEELADVLFVIMALANEQGIDLDEAFEGVLEKYRRRDSDRWTRKEGGRDDVGAGVEDDPDGVERSGGREGGGPDRGAGTT